MQYLKDEIRNKIISESLKEFREKGYKGASIRDIAKNSGTSVGNIYKYFSSKEDLYKSIIEPVYDKVMNYISQFDSVELNDNADKIFYGLMEKIMEIFEENSTELTVLLNKSEGSIYENCKNSFIYIITKLVTEKINYELSVKGKGLRDNFIIFLLSKSLVESIIIVLTEKDNGAEVRNLILTMIDIYFSELADKLEVDGLAQFL